MISEKPIKKLKRCYSGVVTKDHKYYIGTSSASIYFYDYKTTELVKKFQDIPYGDKLYLSNDNSLLVVKGTLGKIGVYDIESLSLRFAMKVKGTSQPQDSNLCFSQCGNYLYNIVYDDDLFSYIMKINLKDGSYEKIYYQPRENYTQITFVPQHNCYYLFGFVRGKEYRDFVRVFNLDFIKTDEVAIEGFTSQVEYSPLEDLFYLKFLSDYSIKVFDRTFLHVVKEISSETVTKVIKGNHSQREVVSSKYGYMSAFSLSVGTLFCSIAYGQAVVIFDNKGKEQRVFPMLGGNAEFFDGLNEVIVKGEIYQFSVDQ